MNKILTIIVAGLINFNCFAQADKELPLYKDPTQKIDLRINDLLSRMTLREKIYQLNQLTTGRNTNSNNIGRQVDMVPSEIGSVIYFSSEPGIRNMVQRKAVEETRLGIPILFGYDVIHGFRTIYPISLAQSCSWNPELVSKACSVAAEESGLSGVNWTFAPMVDVSRDGRWGRVSECYGEDPYINSTYAEASVRGFQGNDLSDVKSVAACLKHYVGYGASEAGRDYVPTEISLQTLWDTYLPSFKAGVNAGALTVMSAFNLINGVPASANRYTLSNVLKDDWNFQGFVVSDWGAIQQLIDQGVAADSKEAAEKAFNAGVDMDMADKCYLNYFEDLINEGKISVQQIDNAVKRILRVKFLLGLFERPYTEELPEDKRYLKPESVQIAEQLAEESIVLLKNSSNILPIGDNGRIALIGPLANNKEDLLGAWSAHGKAEDVTSIYEALRSEFENAEILTARGCDFDGDDKSGFDEAVHVAEQANVIVLCLGEKRGWSGENASRSTISLPAIQEELLKELKKVEKPIILVLSNGRPLELGRIEPACDAIVEMWQPGVPGGKPLSRVLSGRVNPSGKLTITFPFSSGQIPIYYNKRQSGRPRMGKYQDVTSEALFPFGFGLSYTEFNYSPVSLSETKLSEKDAVLTVKVKVTNIGKYAGEETVQLYLNDPVASVARPVRELKRFDKVFLQPGETKEVVFKLSPEDLKFYNQELKYDWESGDFNLFVGTNSSDVKVAQFNWKK